MNFHLEIRITIRWRTIITDFYLLRAVARDSLVENRESFDWIRGDKNCLHAC